VNQALLEPLREGSRQKLERMKEIVRDCGSALVAFSGGVDSAFVVAVAREVLGDRAVALTAHSPSVPRSERDEARALARRIGIRHLEVESREGDDPRYVANPENRCYYCKTELFGLTDKAARDEGVAAVLDGFNADDQKDHRPGHQAAREHRVHSPIAEAGLTKDEVRAWSEAYGLPTWDKPQMACLASRLPYGVEVTPERLAQIEAAEAAVKALGFKDVRVRYHHEVARLEVGADEHARAFQMAAELARAIRTAGFAYATLDLEPFRTGRMNEAIGRGSLRVV
jgi:uncharacterized protein